MEMTRRQFVGQFTAAAAIPWRLPRSSTEAQPILDIHQHVHYGSRSNDDLIAHCRALGVTKAVLLAAEGWMRSPERDGGNDRCLELARSRPELFIRFASADPEGVQAEQVLRTYLKNGGIGIGEQKFRLPTDGTEMRRIYAVAAEFRVPVLIHFQERDFNTGFRNFPKVLDAYPQVNFIGHAPTWWAHISAEVSTEGGYPKGKVKKGGLTDRWLSDYPNLYADLSANSGLTALTRDAEFAAEFIRRHRRKLIWGSDCSCRDGNGLGYTDGKCIGRECLAALRRLSAGDAAIFRQIVWDNGARLLKISS
jgi:predicted TIM-barrel fold metal-dependent hydrolase